jgi:hypothetical protein
MGRINRFAAASALAAAFSMAATPAAAREHRWHHWRHDDRIDAGDVIAGAVILGGIAAIASAANKRDRDEPAPPPVPVDRQDYSYDQPDRDVALDRTADTCVDAVERGRDRVDSVDDVTRGREGWTVSGVLANGGGFACLIGNDGHVENVRVAGSRADAASSDDRSYDGPRHDADDRTAPSDRGDDPPPPADARPEWHGDNSQSHVPDNAPVRGQDDGRYDTSQAPDFGQAV